MGAFDLASNMRACTLKEEQERLMRDMRNNSNRGNHTMEVEDLYPETITALRATGYKVEYDKITITW